MAHTGILRWLGIEWSKHRWHILEALGAVGTAVGAILIPIILDRTADQRHASEIETRTLQTVNEVGREVARVIEENPSLGRIQGKYVKANFSYDAIVKDDKTNKAAIKLLNEYEFVCLGGNKGLFNTHIIKELRVSAISVTWNLYKDYIVRSREESKVPTLWNECEAWLKAADPAWVWNGEE